ncbi:MAG: ATP-binding protein [Acidobacteria bacterium]|nr:ATP-binding protein [Acidobacteriota bacterium]
MVRRRYWIEAIERLWAEKSVVWLSGVRRVGKTFLCRSLPSVEYFDCELPSTRRILEDPEPFLRDVAGRRIVVDEIQRLRNPSELLKIAADYHPGTRVIATGSSSLGASRRFRDTLTDRKRDLRLTPMILQDEEEFGGRGIGHRFMHGGLPPFFLAAQRPEHGFQEWLDSYWSRDIQELFRVERRWSFLRFVELVLAQSGGVFEASRLARPCEISRTTVVNYLRVLEDTFVVQVVRPYSARRASEIVAAPKVYGFDTGFVCLFKGWDHLRDEDRGVLWEHYVLNEYLGRAQDQRVRYWRDKRGHEIDFVLVRGGGATVAIECKWRAAGFDARNLKAFRSRYPDGDNFVVTDDTATSYVRDYGGVAVRFVNLPELMDRVTNRA